MRSLHRTVRLATESLLCLVALVALPRRAEATPLENPFAAVYTEAPPPLLLGLRAGAFHDIGIGPLIGWAPLPALRIEASYAYWTEHSFAGTAQLHFFPCAALTPYIVAGYELAFGRLPYGITLRTDRLVGGVGFEARVGKHGFVRAEMLGNGVIDQKLRDQTTVYNTTPSDVFVARPGFVVGAYLP